MTIHLVFLQSVDVGVCFGVVNINKLICAFKNKKDAEEYVREGNRYSGVGGSWYGIKSVRVK